MKILIIKDEHLKSELTAYDIRDYMDDQGINHYIYIGSNKQLLKDMFPKEEYKIAKLPQDIKVLKKHVIFKDKKYLIDKTTTAVLNTRNHEIVQVYFENKLDEQFIEEFELMLDEFVIDNPKVVS